MVIVKHLSANITNNYTTEKTCLQFSTMKGDLQKTVSTASFRPSVQHQFRPTLSVRLWKVPHWNVWISIITVIVNVLMAHVKWKGVATMCSTSIKVWRRLCSNLTQVQFSNLSDCSSCKWRPGIYCFLKSSLGNSKKKKKNVKFLNRALFHCFWSNSKMFNNSMCDRMSQFKVDTSCT